VAATGWAETIWGGACAALPTYVTIRFRHDSALAGVASLHNADSMGRRLVLWGAQQLPNSSRIPESEKGWDQRCGGTHRWPWPCAWDAETQPIRATLIPTCSWVRGRLPSTSLPIAGRCPSRFASTLHRQTRTPPIRQTRFFIWIPPGRNRVGSQGIRDWHFRLSLSSVSGTFSDPNTGIGPHFSCSAQATAAHLWPSPPVTAMIDR